MATALSAIRETVQVLYDVAGSQVLEDSDWNTLIQASYRKLWRTVVRINKSFRINVDPFVLTTSQTRVLPADYRETLAVRVNPGTDQQDILERLTIRRAQGNWDRAYRLQGTNLYIEPLQRCAGTYDHLYIPTCPVLANDASTLDAELDQFREFIEYDSANVALSREETERLYEIDFQRAEKDVISWASSQRSADPDVVEDVRRPSWWSIGTP